MFVRKHFSISEKNLDDVGELARRLFIPQSEVVRRAIEYYVGNVDRIYNINNFLKRNDNGNKSA